METIKYSVIIPAYNAEKTIARCLDSILCYARNDVEILIVNDGSSDRTEEICLTYKPQKGTIRYFFKKNGGVSSARNLGLDNARGKYILFVDSDDYLCGDPFILADREMPVDKGMLISIPSISKKDLNGGAAIRLNGNNSVANVLSVLLKQQLLNAPCSKVFCNEVIKDSALRFDERLDIGEDKVFVLQYVVRTLTATVCNECFYSISTENPESLSRKKRDDLCESVMLEHELLFSAVEESQLAEQIKRVYKRAVGYSFHRSAYTVIAELRKFDMSRSERIARTKKIMASYSSRKRVLYYNTAHFFFAIPIKLRLAGLVDTIITFTKKAGVCP